MCSSDLAVEDHAAPHRRRALLIEPPELIILFQGHCPLHASTCLVPFDTNSTRDGGIPKFPPSLKTLFKCLPRGPFFSVGQTGAALGAATGQDLAAVGGSHSLAEAMNLLAVQLLGLIGTFRCHIETPPVRIPAARRGGTYSTPPSRAAQ